MISVSCEIRSREKLSGSSNVCTLRDAPTETRNTRRPLDVIIEKSVTRPVETLKMQLPTALKTTIFTLAVGLFLGLSPSQASPAQHGRWHADLSSAVSEAEQMKGAGKPGYLLVDLYADWCGWCKKLERDVFSTTRFQNFAADFSLLRVDTEDGAEGSSLKSRFKVQSLPTTLVLTAAGSLVGEVPGYHPTERMISEIGARIASYEKLLDGFDRWKTSTDVQILNTLAEQFHKRLDGGRSAELYRQMLKSLPADSSDATWVSFRLADSLRLFGRYDAAHDALDKARSRANETTDTELLEQVDLLGIRIAQDMGDCAETTRVLRDFLTSYPKSSFTPMARQTLEKQSCT